MRTGVTTPNPARSSGGRRGEQPEAEQGQDDHQKGKGRLGDGRCPARAENAVRGGSVNPSTLIWFRGLKNWAPAGKVAELNEMFAFK